MMKRLLTSGWIVFLLVLGMSVATAATGGVDDFEMGLDNWQNGGSANDPTVQMGGPNGQFLRAVSDGSGAGGKMVIFNQSAKWIGDYTAANIGQITMEVNASGANDLNVRVVISNGTGGAGTEWVSTVSCDVTAGSGWQTCVFPLSQADMTQFGGDAFATVIANVAEIRLVSAATPNAHLGDDIVAQMDIDNITPQTPTAVMMSQQGVALAQNTPLMMVVFVMLSNMTIAVYGRAWVMARKAGV